MRMTRSSLGVLVAAAVAVVLTAGVASATTVEKVYPSDVGSTWFTADTRAPGSVTFGTTYGGAGGSAAAVILQTPTSSAKAQLLTDAWAGTPLSAITALSYSTYRSSDSVPGVSLPALNLRVDLDGNGVVDRYVVFEPYLQPSANAALPGVWQSWDAIAGGTATWWISGQPTCGQATPCTWSALLGIYPNAQILEGLDFPGSLGFNQGSGNPGLTAAADMLRVATSGRDVTYDFEMDVVLTGPDQCKQGGWATSTDPVFHNQGDCVSSFGSNSKNR